MAAYYLSGYSGAKHKQRLRIRRTISIVFIVLVLVACVIGYKMIYMNNVWLGDQASEDVFIPTNANFDKVKNLLYQKGLIINRKSFEWVAQKKAYPSHIRPGKYLVKRGMSNNTLINMLRSGKQEPVKLVFNNIRTKMDFAQRISEQIEADSSSIIKLLNDKSYVKKFGLNTENILVTFIPNTYETWWNITADELITRMNKEYDKFWTEERKEKAKKIGLTVPQVSILASIVEKETNKDSEKPRIAGVYLNRLKYGMLLEADPTLVWALGDFSIKRVLNEYKKLDSPYNTYKYFGLPPGPICLPSIASIDAVLNFEKHYYLYFCAKDDLSGFHNFAYNYEQHSMNARKYQQALDRMNIKR